MEENKGIVRVFSNYCDFCQFVDIDTGLMEMKTLTDFTLSENKLDMDYEISLQETVDTFAHPSDRERARKLLGLENLRHLSDLKRIQENFIFRSLDKKGAMVYAELQVRFYYNGSQRMALVTTKNLTEYSQRSHKLSDEIRAMKEAEQEQGVNREELLYQMAKDIRRPIHNIVGMCKIASVNEESEKQTKCMDKVRRESLRVLGMVEEVVDMSRIAEKQMRLHPSIYHLADETQGIAKSAEDQLKEKDLKLRVYVENIRFEDLIGDLDRIRQVYTYILLNAIKDSNPGSIIKVWIREFDYYNDQNTIIQLTFEDEGRGMNPDLIEALNNPFYKQAGKTQWGLTGEGYGIPLAKEMVLLMNGHFQIDTMENRGTKVTVTLERPYHGKSAYYIDEKLKHLKLLLLSNDPMLAKDAVEILRKMDIYAETMDIEAFKGYKIEDQISVMRQYDIVMFPREIADESNIFNVRDQLKGKGPKLILTAYDWDALEQIDGMDAYLKKPFYASSLNTAIQQAVGLISKQEVDDQPLWVSGTNILIVEDNEQNQEILVELLKEIGCNVRVAENGFVAKEMVAKKEDGYFDVIIMDIIMPMMDGYEATREIRKLPLKYAKTVPIVALSANTTWEDKEKCKGAGMNAHLAKPIEVNKLHRVLRGFLEDKCLQ